MVLQSIYRHPLVYSDEALEAAGRGLDRLDSAVRGFDSHHAEPDENTAARLADAGQRFRSAMDDDFNSPIAVSVLFDLARFANRADGANRSAAQSKLLELASVLGLQLQPARSERADGNADPFIDLLLTIREQLRAQKQWALSDAIRDGLAELGVIVEDAATGATWRFQD
jgi:cysteinyl-tRNA synthetase